MNDLLVLDTYVYTMCPARSEIPTRSFSRRRCSGAQQEPIGLQGDNLASVGAGLSTKAAVPGF